MSRETIGTIIFALAVVGWALLAHFAFPSDPYKKKNAEDNGDDDNFPGAA